MPRYVGVDDGIDDDGVRDVFVHSWRDDRAASLKRSLDTIVSSEDVALVATHVAALQQTLETMAMRTPKYFEAAVGAVGLLTLRKLQVVIMMVNIVNIAISAIIVIVVIIGNIVMNVIIANIFIIVIIANIVVIVILITIFIIITIVPTINDTITLLDWKQQSSSIGGSRNSSSASNCNGVVIVVVVVFVVAGRLLGRTIHGTQQSLAYRDAAITVMADAIQVPQVNDQVLPRVQPAALRYHHQAQQRVRSETYRPRSLPSIALSNQAWSRLREGSLS